MNNNKQHTIIDLTILITIETNNVQQLYIIYYIVSEFIKIVTYIYHCV